MTVKQVRQKLEHLPDNMQVFFLKNDTDFTYGLVNSVYIKEVSFSEEPDGKTLAKDKAVVFDEE